MHTDNSPTITKQPSSKTIDLRTMNYNLSLSCLANGNVEYSWERFNGTLPNNINGSNTSTLNFTFVSPNDAGKYRCRVSDNNGYYGYSNYGILKTNGLFMIVTSSNEYFIPTIIYFYIIRTYIRTYIHQRFSITL